MSDHDDAFSDWENFDPGDDPYSDAELPAIVDDVRPGETIAERNARIDARNQDQTEADRPLRDTSLDELTRGGVDSRVDWREGETLDRSQANPQTIRVPPARVPGRGAQRGAVLRNSRRRLGRADQLRAFLEEQAASTSFSLEELTRPTPLHLTEPERERRDALARLVAAAREHGAKIAAIAALIERSASTVSALEQRGRVLSA